MSSRPNLCRRSTLRCLSVSFTPHIQRIILKSVLSNLCSSSFFIGQVSLPYNIHDLTQALYTLPFKSEFTSLAVKKGANLRNLSHPDQVLAITAAFAPPSVLIMSLRYQYFSTVS